MVEVSPVLRGLQWQALRCPGPPPAADSDTSAGADPQQGEQGQQACSSIGSSTSSGDNSSGAPSSEAISGVSGWSGAHVSWHRSLEEVEPEGPALYIAHEFLDALPVHQFQRTGGYTGAAGVPWPGLDWGASACRLLPSETYAVSTAGSTGRACPCPLHVLLPPLISVPACPLTPTPRARLVRAAGGCRVL